MYLLADEAHGTHFYFGDNIKQHLNEILLVITGILKKLKITQ